jgi:hypothetical protein
LRGILVFLGVFALVLIVSLGYTGLPPGQQIYGLLGAPETDYPVIGIPATTLVVAALNGIVYGVIAWLIFSLAGGSGRSKLRWE